MSICFVKKGIALVIAVGLIASVQFIGGGGRAAKMAMQQGFVARSQKGRVNPQTGLNQVQQDSLQSHKEYVNGLISKIWKENFTDTSAFAKVAGQTIFSDLTSFASSYASGGDGSVGNPYIFDGLFINASVTEMYFDSVTAYFVLRNSLVLGKMTISASNVKSITNTVLFSSSYALRLLGVQDMEISGNTIVANGTSYAIAIYGSKILDIRNNIILTSETAGAVVLSSGSFTVINVNFTQNQFQTLSSVIYSTSGFGGDNRLIGNIFNSSSISTFITILPRGNIEFRDNTVMVHYSPNKWNGNIFFGGIGGGTGDVWTIRNNTVSGLEDGFFFSSPKVLELENNTIRESLHGVRFYDGNNQSRIHGNIIEDTQIGFYIRISDNNTIDGSILRRVGFGAIFEFATGNVLNNTYIEDFNLLMYDITANNPPNRDFNTNTVGKKDEGINVKTDGDLDAMVTTEGLPGNGTPDDPYVISKLTIDGGLGLAITTNYTIKLKDLVIKNVFADIVKPLSITSDNGLILENVTVINATNGIFLDTKGSLVIINSSFSGFMYFSTIKSGKSSFIDGIRYTDSEEGLSLSLENSVFSNFELRNVYGSQQIYVSGTNLTFTDGSITGGTNAFKVSGSSNVTIKRTIINGTEKPVYVSEVFGFVFKDNYVTLSEYKGVVEYSDNINVTGNMFVDNKDSVFYIEVNYLNKPFSIWNNYFINNSWEKGRGHIETYDELVLTVDGVGNYWSDLRDGETEYYVQGYADTAPIRPSIEPVQRDVEYDTTISISMASKFPVPLDSWVLFQNGTMIQNGTWNTDGNQFTFSPMKLGKYAFEIGVRDKNNVKGLNTSIVINVVDTTAPTIVSAGNVIIHEGETVNPLVWQVNDWFPDSYEVLKNNTSFVTGTWSSTENITLDISGLGIGTYNFTLIAKDKSGNTGVDEIIVQVLPITSSSTTSNTKTETPTTTTSLPKVSMDTTTTISNKGNGKEKSTNGRFLLFIVIIINMLALYFGAKSYYESRH